jgi:hypothetical protein
MIWKALSEINLFSLKDRYGEQNDCDSFSKDQSSTITTIKISAKKKKIYHYLGCYDRNGMASPHQLTLFENKIDKIVNSSKWTGYQ